MGIVRRGKSAIRPTVRLAIMGIFYHVILARSAGHIPDIICSIIILLYLKKKKIKKINHC